MTAEEVLVGSVLTLVLLAWVIVGSVLQVERNHDKRKP